MSVPCKKEGHHLSLPVSPEGSWKMLALADAPPGFKPKEKMR